MEFIGKQVCIIGNNASNKKVSDGGRIKIRLYKTLLEKNGVTVRLIELDHWKKHFFKLIFKIKSSIKDKQSILIMAGPKGCRVIIPIVNFLNRKKDSRVVFCPLGIGTLDKLLKGKTPNEISLFLNNENYFSIEDKKMKKNLNKLDLIIPQNDIIADCFKKYYGINNVKVVNNFRDVIIEQKEYRLLDCFSIIFVSRVCKEKGIFDLINVVSELNKNGFFIKLDIFGEMQLDENDRAFFETLLNNEIKYCGLLEQEDSIKQMKKYNLFVLPTKYYGEGTSGSLIESFLSGTPALISSYSQAHLLIEDCVNGFIFKIGDVNDLRDKLIFIINNKKMLEKVGVSAQHRAEKYTFTFNSKNFFECILGEQNEDTFNYS